MSRQPASVARDGHRRISAACVLLLLIFVAAAVGTFAQEDTPTELPHTVPRATSGVTIDGVIEEQAWQDALTLELKYEIRPGENAEPPVRTLVFITYDERYVLVAFRAFDHEPEKIRARYRDRDRTPATTGWGSSSTPSTISVVHTNFISTRSAFKPTAFTARE